MFSYVIVLPHERSLFRSVHVKRWIHVLPQYACVCVYVYAIESQFATSSQRTISIFPSKQFAKNKKQKTLINSILHKFRYRRECTGFIIICFLQQCNADSNFEIKYSIQIIWYNKWIFYTRKIPSHQQCFLFSFAAAATAYNDSIYVAKENALTLIVLTTC